MKDTYFASATRSSEALLKEEIRVITESPIVDMLMTTIGGLFAILDSNRQMVAINQSLLKELGIKDVSSILGARPGEAIGCVHASELPGGCGTTKSCRTCGAVVAILSSLKLNKSVEETCLAEVNRNGETSSLYLGVRATPIEISQHQFILLYLQDLSAEQEIAMLEKVFYNDINNILTGLLGNLEILPHLCEGKAHDVALLAKETSKNLYSELCLQRILIKNNISAFDIKKQEISVNSIVEEACITIKNHSAIEFENIDKTLLDKDKDKKILSDRYLIVKILKSMLMNAIEASEQNDIVKIKIEQTDVDEVVFSVWNKTEIPENIQQRIFQKNFTTKNMHGRGLGTYSMKMFGEAMLKGKIYFTSDNLKGTHFYFKLGTFQ